MLLMFRDLRYAVYHCINIWLATNKCYASCDHLVSMVIKDTGALVEVKSMYNVQFNDAIAVVRREHLLMYSLCLRFSRPLVVVMVTLLP